MGSAASACPAAAIEKPMAVAPSNALNVYDACFGMIVLPGFIFLKPCSRLMGEDCNPTCKLGKRNRAALCAIDS
jgi:hypothetical protein